MKLLNFPTKIHWRNPSRIEWIESGLKKFVSGYEKLGIRDISFPRLGCGNGGLDWDDVRPLMERHLSKLSIPVFVHDYTVDIGLPEHLDEIQATLRSTAVTETYHDFAENLREVVSLTGGHFVDVEDHRPFSAKFVDEESLRVFAQGREWDFDNDALWTVWIGLQRGLLTSEKVGWATSEGGKQLLSIVSLLPGMRAIEVQEADGEKQIAVEYKSGSRKSSVVPGDRSEQMSLSWR